MSETHIYCCDRCGTIFEDEGEQEFCADCRALLAKPTARVITYEHNCIRCGIAYRSKASQSKYCATCRGIVHNEQKRRWFDENPGSTEPKPKKRLARGQASIIEDVKRAAALGMSYGVYKSKIREG